MTLDDLPSYVHTLVFPDGVAIIWTEERRKAEGPDAPEVPVDFVYDFLRWSKPTPAGARIPHRYADHPMPYPRGTRGPRQPGWHADQIDDLRAFWHDRLPVARNRARKAIEDPQYRTKAARKLGITEEQLLADANQSVAAAKARKDEWASHR